MSGVCVYLNIQNDKTMTTSEINNERNEKGVYSDGNDVAGWFAISRDNINLITYYEDKYTFSQKEDVIRRYTDRGFAIRITQLQNRGY